MGAYLKKMPMYQASRHQQVLHNEREIFATANKGLLFERWFGGYTDSWKVDNQVTEGKGGQAFHPLKAFAGTCGDEEQLAHACARQLALVNALGGVTLPMTLDGGNMVSGLGEAHALENGFRWHYTLGTPYLPACAIKGMLRAYLAQWDDSDGETRFSDAECEQIFGPAQGGPQSSLHAGEILFFDAIPLTPPMLTLDVLTPHVGAWYSSDKSQLDDPSVVPADWQSPVPVPFLAVKKADWLFSLAARDPSQPGATARLEKLKEKLILALATLGFGAKTALGYGVMKPTYSELVEQHQLRAEQQRLAQMSAEQREIDALAKKLQHAENDKARENCNSEIDALVVRAQQWPQAARLQLVEVIQQQSLWLNPKKKQRERKARLQQLITPRDDGEV